MAKQSLGASYFTENSLSDIWLHVNSTDEGFKEILDYFKDLRNSPFKIEKVEISSALALMVATNLISTGGKDEEPDSEDLTGDDQEDTEPDSAAEEVGDVPAAGKKAAEKGPSHEIVWKRMRGQGSLASVFQNQTANFKASPAQVGTHSAKIPNTAASGKTVFTVEQPIYAAAQSSPFLSSMTVSTKQRLGAGTNASQNATNRFLLMSFLINGEIVNFGESIVERGIIYDTLIEIGMSPQQIDELSTDLVKERDTSANFPLGPNQRCLIWPTEDGDIQITPVHPFAIHFEMNSRVKRRKETDNWINTRAIKVGGSQPQNSGVINNMFSGFHYLLESLPPKTLSVGERTHYKHVKLGKIEFASLRKTDDNAVALVKALTKKGGMNMENRAVIVMLTERVIRSVLFPYFQVAKFFREHTDQIDLLDNISGDSCILLEKGFEYLVSRDDFCKAAARKALSGLKGVPVSDELDVIFRKTAEDIMRANFKGI